MNLKSPIHAPQSVVQRLFAEAAEQNNRGNYPEVIALLRRAFTLDSTNAAVALDLGRIHATVYDFAEAERWFEKALVMLEFQPEALLNVGHHWLSVRNYEAAQKTFERALNHPEVPIQTFIRLAEIYERHGKQDDALTMIERALKQETNYAPARHMQAKIFRQAKQWERAEELLRALVSNPNCDPSTRPAAWYELASVLDSQKRFDEAMSAFCEAKSLLAGEGTRALPRLRAKQAMIRETEKNLTEKIMQRWQAFGQTQLQPARKLALLCGHARSGTTLLEYVLDAHPQIISADETSVLANQISFALGRGNSAPPPLLPLLDSMTGRTMRQMRADYFRGMESFLGQPIGERLLIDKNPGLTFDLPVFLRLFPETKFLVALRDPRDVCLSCFMQFAPIVTDSVAWLSLEKTVENYASIMGLWLTLKPHLKNAAIEVRYEDMVENLESNARRVLEFLGLPWDERLLRFNEHAQSKTVCSPTYAEVTKPVYKNAVGRWRNYEKYFEPHLEKLRPFLRAFGYE